MNLTLCYAPTACSLVPYVTLTEAGAKFAVDNVNMRAGGNRTADYLRFNPKGKVPVLAGTGGNSTNEAIYLTQEAEKLGVPFLGEVPLHLDIRTTSDSGQPIVASKPDSAHAQVYKNIAGRVWKQLSASQRGPRAAPKIVVR